MNKTCCDTCIPREIENDSGSYTRISIPVCVIPHCTCHKSAEKNYTVHSSFGSRHTGNVVISTADTAENTFDHNSPLLPTVNAVTHLRTADTAEKECCQRCWSTNTNRCAYPSCLCHSEIAGPDSAPTTDTSDWRERFQEQFVAPPPFEETLYAVKPEYIKAFIEKELESQSAQMTKAFHGELERQIEKAREEEKPWLVQQIHNNAFEAGKEAGREEALSTVKIGRNSEIVIGSPCWRAAMTEGRAAERARLRERIAFLPAPPQWTEQSWHEAKADILNLLKLNLLKGDNS